MSSSKSGDTTGGFNIGDIVQLKSGGPKMTVGENPNPGRRQIYCQWFAGSKLEQGYFAKETLMAAQVGKKESPKSV